MSRSARSETPLKRALTPATNPTGIGSALAAVYAGIVMIVNAVSHHAVIDPQVIVAALTAAGFLYARFKVTPVADPRDGNGQPLTAVPVRAAKTLIPPAAAPADTPAAAGPAEPAAPE